MNLTATQFIYTSSSNPSTTSVSQQTINEELMDNTWDYATEVIFMVLIAILTIPANLFLFLLYMKKIRRYKRLKHLNARYVRIANSFHTYMIEICSFDTTIVIYLILNTFFQFLFHLKKSEYESVYDISNFTCKFFIYILRISGAMSNYLVFLLSLNRCLLILFRYKPMQLSSHRLCLNTKYLTLFLFCICTIANVFRLELLNINPGSSSTQSQIQKQMITSKHTINGNNSDGDFNLFKKRSVKSDLEFEFELDLQIQNQTKIFDNNQNLNNLLQSISDSFRPSECGPNMGSISFTIGDSTNTLFWSIIIYNIFFSILPALGNLILSIYLIKKRSELKHKLVLLIDFLVNAKLNEKFIKTNDLCDQIQLSNNINNNNNNNYSSINSNNIHNYEEIMDPGEVSSKSKSNDFITNKLGFQLNEFHTEFLKTCTPCIAFSLTHVILFLPYSIIELINQIKPTLTYMTILQYMTYIRYFFYCSKFYLLFFVSYRFRREFRKFCKKKRKFNINRKFSYKRKKRDSLNLELKHFNDMNTINSAIISNIKINTNSLND